MSHSIECHCGTLQGHVLDVRRVNRCMCYCKDCQCFAHFLGRAAEILDDKGGTEIVQTVPANIGFTTGHHVIACMRLKPQGLLRWYTICCNTPIGNTLPSMKMSFIGLVHNCLQAHGASLDDFGPIGMRVNTTGAKAPVETSSLVTLGGMLRVAAMLARARIDGSYKRTPFFSVGSGMPVVDPKILSREERDGLRQAL
jgi:Family of unknown function (DUF6151)